MRTVGREEFTRMRGSNGWDERLAERRKGEERGMGNMLRSSGPSAGGDGASYGETECYAGDNVEEAD